MNDLVTDMMDLTRRRKPEFAEVDVAEVAQEVVALASQSGRGRADVAIEYRGVDAARVVADAAQLRQMVVEPGAKRRSSLESG